MAVVISSLKVAFVLLNILTLFSSAFYFGFGIFLSLSQADALGYGMKQIAVASFAAAAAVILFSIVGFSAVSGRRRLFMKFQAFLLICLSVFEFTFAILCAIRYSKVEEFTSVAWDDMTENSRIAFEAAYSCCGFKNSEDRTACSPERLASSPRPCSVQLSGRQQKVLRLLVLVCVITGAISLITYIVSCALCRMYTKAQLRFKHQQAQQRLKSKFSKKEGANATEEEKSEIVQTESINSSSSKKPNDRHAGMFLSDLFRPVPKPIKNTDSVARSSGSNLTYEEIVAKYRPSKA